MAKRFNKKDIRKITKIGGHSYGVILPIEVVKNWRWKERQKVVLEINQKKKVIKIKDWKKK